MQAAEDRVANVRIERVGDEGEILGVEREQQANEVVARRNGDE